MRVFSLFFILFSTIAALGAALPPDPGSGEPSVWLFSCILCYSLFNSIHTSRQSRHCPSGAPELAHSTMWLFSDTGRWRSPLQLFILFYSILCILFYSPPACASVQLLQTQAGEMPLAQLFDCILVSPFVHTSPVSQIDSFRHPGWRKSLGVNLTGPCASGPCSE